MKVLFVALMLLLGAPAVNASEPGPNEDSLQILVAQQRELQAKIASGSAEGVTPRQLKLIRKAQDTFFSTVEGKSSLDDLSIDEKVRVENALESINAEVRNTPLARDEKSFCWREKATGTTVKTTRCGTEAEMREAREGARGYLERPKTCGKDCGGL